LGLPRHLFQHIPFVRFDAIGNNRADWFVAGSLDYVDDTLSGLHERHSVVSREISPDFVIGLVSFRAESVKFRAGNLRLRVTAIRESHPKIRMRLITARNLKMKVSQ
jgi:hypothetical protein